MEELAALSARFGTRAEWRLLLQSGPSCPFSGIYHAADPRSQTPCALAQAPSPPSDSALTLRLSSALPRTMRSRTAPESILDPLQEPAGRPDPASLHVPPMAHDQRLPGQGERGEGREEDGHLGDVLGLRELAVYRLPQHDLHDDLILGQAKFLGLLGDLPVERGACERSQGR